MKRKSAIFFLLLFASDPGFGQNAGRAESRITRINPPGTPHGRIEMRNSHYDAARNFLPYYLLTHETGYNEKAKATLIVKDVTVLKGEAALAVREAVGSFIGRSFQLSHNDVIARHVNLNSTSLVPFRINDRNEIEELVSYDVQWSVTSSSAPRSNLKPSSSFTASSVLSSGTWYKIGITQTGVHRITRSFLSAIGVNVQNLDPRNIRVYGNGGHMIPEKNGDPRPDDLIENAIYASGEQDGKMDGQDYFLFYATGTTEWKRSAGNGLKFSAIKSLYSDTSFYYICTDLGPGKRMQVQPSSQSQPNVSTGSYDYYNYHEANIYNFAKSGRKWYGEYFDIVTAYTFNWSDGEFLTNDTLIAETAVAANGKEKSFFTTGGNGLNFDVSVDPVPGGDYPPYAYTNASAAKGLNNNASEIRLTITKTTPKTVGWVDKLTINARRALNVSARQFCFRDTRVVGSGNFCRYSLNVSAGNPLILNTTDPLNPFIQSYNLNGGVLDFVAASSTLNEYCVADVSDHYQPVFVGKIANQNLHAIQSAQYVIVAHPLFVREAQKLGAFHQEKEGLSYVVVTTEQIYNEFSSGKQDISAIRDFVRMLYTRNAGSNDQVRYLLLMGDGSYNNMSRNIIINSNMIPTYQSHNSLSPTQSVASDDFYGLMDPDEGVNAEGDPYDPALPKNKQAMDIGVGRFTCRNKIEVNALIGKIENYYRKDPSFMSVEGNPQSTAATGEGTMGDWRNWVMLLADDGDAAEHMEQADDLQGFITGVAPHYNIDKIFLDAYQRISTPGGSRYPETLSDFNKRINKGTLVFNYTGHGGEVGLTAERLIDVDLINGFSNFNKLPLFITATCEFSRYDDPGRTSAGELSLLNAKGGAVALMTTCRLAYSHSNFALNSMLLQFLFQKMPDGSMPALGDALRRTKAHLLQDYMYSNFHLLGDPALRLAYPEQRVYTTEINGAKVTAQSSDTLGALSRITISGFVGDSLGNKLSSFNGVVYPTVFDKEQLQVCLLNTRESADNYHPLCDTCRTPFSFKQQKNILYRGKATVRNGEFTFTFIVPKDISFAPGRGRISYYATDGLIDANGSYTSVVVGGTGRNVINDDKGPDITLYFNDKTFVNGGLTNHRPVLFAELSDSSGINTVGTGLGHDVSAIVDANAANPIIMNDYYEANLNSYQSGRVRYQFEDLKNGEHRLQFKAWDILNNSSTAHIDFVVAQNEELAIEHVLNYPNPFTSQTKFMFEHNQAFSPLKVVVEIYTVSGKLVKTLQKTLVNEGFRPEGIVWNGQDDYGDRLARGVYIYKLAVINQENKRAEKIEKLVILN